MLDNSHPSTDFPIENPHSYKVKIKLSFRYSKSSFGCIMYLSPKSCITFLKIQCLEHLSQCIYSQTKLSKHSDLQVVSHDL